MHEFSLSKLKLTSLSNKYINISLVILILMILPYIYLAFFSVPSSDDYFHAAKSIEKGIFGFVKWRYLTWNGRYSSDFLIASYNSIGHKFFDFFLIKFFWIIPLFLITFYFFASWLFVSLIIGIKNLKLNIIYPLIITICILTVTKLDETVFWLAGGTAYGLANSLTIISITITIYTFYINQNNLFLFFTNLFLIFFINGLSETVMVTHTSFLVTIIFFNILILSKKSNLSFLLKNLAYLTGGIGSFLIVYLAPGNVNRSTKFAEDQLPSLKKLIVLSVKSLWASFHYFVEWINPFWLCFIFLSLFLINKIIKNKNKYCLTSNKKILGIILLSLLVAFYFSHFVVYYSTDRSGADFLRTKSISYTIFLLLSIFSCLYLLVNLPLNPWKKILKSYKIFFAFILLFCCFSLAVNGENLANDFIVLRDHNKYYQINYPIVIKAKSGSSLKLPPEPRVRILRYSDKNWGYLQTSKKAFPNKWFSLYFDLESISISWSLDK